eukprot:TRINITY_DN3877_c0_g1_i2.p1 TRINITY_DN3877_c0_g1~~TRINITY_DN3877_c0_g1_i2.p1  ORF type:complete len:285 (-),score=69.50 TRINITY_DN3877_c0_g1_i2:771-1625(-)
MELGSREKRLEALLCVEQWRKDALKDLCEKYSMPKSGTMEQLRARLVNAVCVDKSVKLSKLLSSIRRDVLDGYAKRYMSEVLQEPDNFKVKALREEIAKFIIGESLEKALIEKNDDQKEHQVWQIQQEQQLSLLQQRQPQVAGSNNQEIREWAVGAVVQFESFWKERNYLKLGEFMFPESKFEAIEGQTGAHVKEQGAMHCLTAFKSIVELGYWIERVGLDIHLDPSGMTKQFIIDSWGQAYLSGNPYGCYQLRLILSVKPGSGDYLISCIEMKLGMAASLSMF